MKSHKEDSSAMVKRFLRPVIIGAVVRRAVRTLLLAVLAAIVASQDIPKAAITPMAIVAAAAGAFFGGFAARAHRQGKGAADRRGLRPAAVHPCGAGRLRFPQ